MAYDVRLVLTASSASLSEVWSVVDSYFQSHPIKLNFSGKDAKNVGKEAAQNINAGMKAYTKYGATNVFGNITKEVNTLQKTMGNTDGVQATTTATTALMAKVTAMQKMESDGVKIKKKDYKELAQLALKQESEMQALSKSNILNNQGLQRETYLNNLSGQMDTYFSRYGQNLKNNIPLLSKFNELQQKFTDGSFDGSKTQAGNAWASFRKQARDAGVEIDTLGSKLSNLFKQHFNTAVVMFGLHAISGALRGLYNNVVELDKSVVNLQIATGGTRSEMKALLGEYAQMGQELGATTIEVADSADTFLRQGKTYEETNALIKDSMMLSKLGQIDSAEAAKNLTSAMKGYNIEAKDAIGIVDQLTAVDIESATTAGGLATAMAETAVGARIAGVSMQKLIGYIATVSEVTQDGDESVGVFYKTLFSRMGNVRQGNLIDPESGELLSNVETVLEGYGIKLRDSNEEFRNFGDVLDEVAGKWDSYGSVAQRAIAVAFSGLRQQEKFLVLMENYDTAMNYEEVATDSAGTANEKYGAYLEGVEAHANTLTAALQNLSTVFLNSDTVTGFLDALTGIVNVLAAVTEFATPVGLIAMVAAFSGIIQGASQFSAAMSASNLAVANGATAYEAMQVAMAGLSREQAMLLLSTSNLSVADQRTLALEMMGIPVKTADVAATTADTAATEANTVATIENANAQQQQASAGKLAVKSFISSAMGIASIIGVIIGIGSAIYSAYKRSLDNTISKSGEAIERLKSEIDSIDEQKYQNLLDIRSIRESLATGDFDGTLRTELATLESQTAELEKQKAIKEEILVREQKTAEEAAIKKFNLDNGRTFALEGFVGNYDDMQRNLADYQTLKRGLDQKIATRDAIDLSTEGKSWAAIQYNKGEYRRQGYDVNALQSVVDEKYKLLETQYAALSSMPDEIIGITNQGKEFLEYRKQFMTDYEEMIYGAIAPSKKEASPAESIASTQQAAISGAEQLRTSYDALSTALSAQAQAGYLTYDAYKALIEVNADYATVVDNVNGKMMINTDRAKAVTAASEEQVAQTLVLQRGVASLELETMLLNTTYEELDQSQKDRADSLKAEIANYDLLIQSIREANSAMQEYQTAAETPNTGSNYDYAIQNIKGTIEAGIKSGRTQTDDYRKALAYMTGSESGGMAAGQAFMDKYGGLLTGDTAAVQTFLDMSQAAGVLDDKFNMITDISAQDWANSIGVGVGLTRDFIGYANEFEGIDFPQYLQKLTDQEFFDASGAQKYIDLADQIATAKQKIADSEDTGKQQSALTEYVDLIKGIDPDELQGIVDVLGQMTPKDGEKGYQEEAKALQGLLDEYNTVAKDTLGKDIVATITDATGQEYTVNITAGSTIATISQQLDDAIGKERVVSISFSIGGVKVGGSGKGAKGETGGISGYLDSILSLFGLASGGITKNGVAQSAATGGRRHSSDGVLVGEIAPEAVVDMDTGTWSIVGKNGAEFVNLPRNSIVFNHLQTKNLLQTGRINSRGESNVGYNSPIFASAVGGLARPLGSGIKPPGYQQGDDYYYGGGAGDWHQPTGGGNPSGGSGKPSVDLSETYKKEAELLEYQMSLLEKMLNLYAKGSEDWFTQQQNIIDTYTAAAVLAQSEYDRLKAAGKDVTSEEMRELSETIIGYKEQIFEASEEYWNAEKDNAKKALEAIKSRAEAVISLKKSYHDTVKAIQSEQITLEAEYKKFLSAYPLMSDSELAQSFDDDDYLALMGELSTILADSNSMYDDYLDKIQAVGSDETYKLEEITDEFERQYELKMDEYNVAKAELGVLKARQQLENAEKDRSQMVIRNGKWVYAPDSDKVMSAIDELAQAEQEYVDSQSDASYNADIASLEGFVSEIDGQIEAIDNLVFSMDSLAEEVHTMIDTINTDVFAAMSDATEALLSVLPTYGSTSTALFDPAGAQALWNSLASGIVAENSSFVTAISSSLSTALQDLLIGNSGIMSDQHVENHISIDSIDVTDAAIIQQFIDLLAVILPLKIK